jgi:hypothetical protein
MAFIFVIFEMLVELEVFCHGDHVDNGHPRAIEVTPLWIRFSRFQEQAHCLNGA